MKINITTTDTEIAVETPYSADFVQRCRQLSGRWSAPTKAWIFPIALKEDVLQALNEFYGYVNDARQERVTLKVTVHDDLIADCAPVRFGPYELAKAYGRDSGAKPGPDVALISGRIRSGGSRKNWDSRVLAGTVFKLVDVPLSVAERLREIAVTETFIVYERIDDATYETHEVAGSYRLPDGTQKPDGCVDRWENGRSYYWARRIEKQVFTVEEV